MRFCGNGEQFGEGAATYKLANQRPKFYVRSAPPKFTVPRFIELCEEAFARWSRVCDVIFTPTNDPAAAQFAIFTHQFDGPSGILADCMFPSPGLRQQHMRIDPTERWHDGDDAPAGSINVLAVLCHEMGHGLGVAHLPSGPPPDLMEPAYNPAITRPQHTESAYVAKLYGPPQIQPPAPTPPLGDSLGVELLVTQGTVKYRAQGTAKRIA